MSNADIFALGFDVDTAALAQGKVAADQMAKALLEIAKAMQAEEAAAKRAGDAERKAAEERKKAEEAARRAADPHLRLADALGRIGQQAQGLSGSLGGLGGGFTNLGTSLSSPQGVNAGLTGMSNGLTALATRLGPVGAGVALVSAGVLAMTAAVSASVVAIAQQQEKYLLLEARLKNIYENGEVAKRVFADLSDLANKNGVAVATVAEGYLRLARTNESIGLTRKQMLDLTDAVQMLGRVSNASQGELQGGLMQFSQALAAGRLNGDELRSIMESLPSLAEAIAKGLGVSVGQLRAMGAEGQLTSDKITTALLGQLPKIKEEFEGLPDTSEQAFTRVGNAWDSLVARMGEVLNLSGIVTGFGNALAAVIEGGEDLITAETDEERYQRLRAMAPYKADADYRSVGRTVRSEEQEADFRNLQYSYAQQAKSDALEGMLKSDQASVSRAIQVGTDVEKLLKQRKELETQIATVKAGIAAAQRSPVSPEQQAGVDRLTSQLAALEQRLKAVKAPLQDYIDTTDRMRTNLATYGAGGAASIADEAKKLFDAGAAAGGEGVMTMQEAMAAVIDRRIASTEQATAAMDADIAAQERMRDAIGKGAQAQIDAEVATKAHAYQMANFGETLDGPARLAVERYADKLRELMQVQKELTDAQRQQTAEMKLAIETQITAAIRAGATSGEIARLRRELETGQSFGLSIGGAAASVQLGNGAGGIPVQYQGYFDAASRASGVPVSVLAAVARQESNFDPNAVSSGNARGIMQVLPSTARDPGMGVAPLAESLLHDPQQNIMFGAQYLAGIARTNGLDLTNPTDLRAALRLYGGADAGGDANYDSNVMRWMPTEAQAGDAEAAVAAEQAAQASAQRVAALDKEAEAVARVSAADSAYAKAQAEREEQIRKAKESAQTPAEAAQIEGAMRAKMAAEDKAALADRLRQMDEANKKATEMAKLAQLPKREMLIETQLLEEINRLKAMGIKLTEDEIKLLRQKITEGVDIDLGQQEKTSREKFKDVWFETAEAIGGALESAISQAVMTGKVDAESILKGLIADITTAITRAFIVQPLVQGLQDLFPSALGSVQQDGYSVQYAYGGIASAFAAGGVVASPTLFPMARGAGLMGEAGPEAILPLSRGTDGKLGVQSNGGGGGTSIVINDMRTSAGSEPVEAQESTGPDGQRMISILVRDEVRQQVRSGALDKEMRASFGLSRQLTKR